MTDEQIDPKVIEAALVGWYGDEVGIAVADRFGASEKTAMEAAIRAADEARGLKEKYRRAGVRAPGSGEPMVILACGAGNAEEARLVSDWRPVERGGEDG